MFASVGRRLALLNAVVVVAAIALAGIATFILLRQSLDREADRALAERAAAARGAWEEIFTAGQERSGRAIATPDSDDDEEEADQEEDEDRDDREEREEHELIESGDILLFGVDAHGRLLANARGLAIPGLPDQASLDAALAGAIDARGIRLAGETLRVYSEPVHHDGRLVGAVQAARNDREHQAELQLVGLISLIGLGLGAVIAVPAGLFLARRAMQPIGEAFARQRAFVADASHELRTPLTLIRATAEMVQRLPDTSPEVRAELEGVLEEVDTTSRLVDDLLLLARLDSRELPLLPQPVDLGAIVRAAGEPLAALAREAGLTLTFEAAPGLTVNADAARIRQVVRILLDNAIAYTPAGGSVQVAVARRGTRGIVQVRDTGTGIAPAEQAQVFDRFYRADRARSRATGGSGLGLAIARALVEAHQGEIGLESQPGRGTTVWFSLPLVPGHGKAFTSDSEGAPAG